MTKLTKAQVKFLLKNEDKLPLEVLAKKFKCTSQEVYAIYDRITSTKEYREYTRGRIEAVSWKLKTGGKENDEMDSIDEIIKSEGTANEGLPLWLTDGGISNRATDNFLRDNVETGCE